MEKYFLEIKLYKADTFLFKFLIDNNDLPKLIKALPENQFGMVIINGIPGNELNTNFDSCPLLTFCNSDNFYIPYQRTIKEG